MTRGYVILIGITGANGRLGTATIKLLLSNVPKEEIVAFIRNLDKANELQSLGVQIRQADYDNKASFEQGLKGIDTLLLISAHDVGRRVAQHSHVIDAANVAGVKRLVYTSFIHTKKPDWTLLLEHYQTEEYIRSSGLEYVICRNSHYIEPMIADMDRIIKEGSYTTSATNGFAYVSIPDLARTFAELLAFPDKVQPNKVYNFTGPELVTPERYYSIIKSQTDKELNFHQVSEEEMKQYLQSIGVSEASMDGWIGFERMQSNGFVSVLSSDIESITGIRPKSMTEFMHSSTE